MDVERATRELTATDLAARFPSWTLWRSDVGRWWATWHGARTREWHDAGCDITVDADDLAELERCLAEQERLAKSV